LAALTDGLFLARTAFFLFIADPLYFLV
jgi:hypothetical protein